MFVTEQKLNSREKIKKHVEFLFVDDYEHMKNMASAHKSARDSFAFGYTDKYKSFKKLLERRFTKVSQLFYNTNDEFEDTPGVDLRIIVFQIDIRVVGHQIKSIGEQCFSKSYPHVMVILRQKSQRERLPSVDMDEIWLDENVPDIGIVEGKYYSDRNKYQNGLGVLMEYDRGGEYFGKSYDYRNIPALDEIVKLLNSDKYIGKIDDEKIKRKQAIKIFVDTERSKPKSESKQAKDKTFEYYGILGVDQKASLVDIKKAFRKISLEMHPDKNPSAKATERYKKVVEAYNVIGTYWRPMYDELGDRDFMPEYIRLSTRNDKQDDDNPKRNKNL
jgi:hypothetical protein